MTTAPQELDPLDIALIGALAGGASTTEAAAAVGCGASTAYRRAARPGFRARLAEAAAQLWKPEATAAKLEVRRSLETLAAIRDNENGVASTRVRACEAIINAAAKLAELVETRDEIARLNAGFAMLADGTYHDPD